MLAARINGSELSIRNAVALDDRGLNYGDGLFETMLLGGGSIRLVQSHLERLRRSCERLAIAYPGDEILLTDVRAVVGDAHEGVIKILLTRGVGGRGYRPPTDTMPTRVVTLHSVPRSNPDIRAQWCATRLSRNPALAGMKHTNRLEQVLAAAELLDATIDEGLMLDLEGEVVCGTSSNVFIVRHGELITSDLRFCGVQGVMRAHVLRLAQSLQIPIHEQSLYPHDFDTATEVFVTNAVRGIRAVVRLGDLQWQRGPVTEALSKALESNA